MNSTSQYIRLFDLLSLFYTHLNYLNNVFYFRVLQQRYTSWLNYLPGNGQYRRIPGHKDYTLVRIHLLVSRKHRHRQVHPGKQLV